jgi:hypothetical protein
MGFEVPVASDFDPSDSVFVTVPMRAHLAIVDCDEDGTRLGGKNNKGEMVVEFEVIAGTVSGQEAMRHRSYFTKSAAAAWRIHRLAIAAGLITSEQVEAHKKNNTMPVYEFERDLKGRQIFADMVEAENPNNGKKSIKIEGGLYHLASRTCLDKVRWPRNEAMVARSGVTMPTPIQQPAVTAKHQPASKPATVPAGGGDAGDDLLSGVL